MKKTIKKRKRKITKHQLIVKIFDVIAVSVLGGFYLVLQFTFWGAYFNGYQVLIDINRFGEAHLEAILMVASFPLVVSYIYQELMKHNKRVGRRKKK